MFNGCRLAYLRITADNTTLETHLYTNNQTCRKYSLLYNVEIETFQIFHIGDEVGAGRFGTGLLGPLAIRLVNKKNK